MQWNKGRWTMDEFRMKLPTFARKYFKRSCYWSSNLDDNTSHFPTLSSPCPNRFVQTWERQGYVWEFDFLLFCTVAFLFPTNINQNSVGLLFKKGHICLSRRHFLANAELGSMLSSRFKYIYNLFIWILSFLWGAMYIGYVHVYAWAITIEVI